MMLVLLAAAQEHRILAGILDMQADDVVVKLAAGLEIDDVEHGMARADDVERRIEDMSWHRHGISCQSIALEVGSSMACLRFEGLVDVVALPAGFLVVDLHIE